jgi:hypothetical protein
MNVSKTQHYFGITQPYPMSFLDKFMLFIQRLPLPYWMTYLLLFMLQVVIFHILSWIDGWIPRYTFSVLILIFPLWQWLPFIIITYLNSVALKTLSIFNPLLKFDEENLKKLKYEFTFMPSNHVILNAVFWAIVYSAVDLFTLRPLYTDVGLRSTFSTIVSIEGLICYCTGSVIYYHSVRQLLLVNKTVKLVEHFNLFHLEPVYAFSRLTAQTGISWVILLGLTILLVPLNLANGVMLGIFFVQVLMAAAAFVLPLWVVRQRLLLEKRKLITENHHRVEAVLALLHQEIDEKKLSEVEQLNSVISGLSAERDILEKIPTFPWRTETLTGFLSATILPIILLIIQLIIEKWLST